MQTQATGALRHGIPFAEYQGRRSLNISALKNIGRSPLYYRYRLDHPMQPTAAMELGTATHAAVLEPDRFSLDYVGWDGGRRAGKAWEEFQATAAGGGVRILPARDYESVLEMQTAVRANPFAAAYLATGAAEVTMEWADDVTGRDCKGRADWITRDLATDVVVGLKTAKDCRPIPFGNQAARLGYHLQWAFYFDGWTTIHGKAPRMVEIVVENVAPHDVAVYVIGEDVLEAGRVEYRRLMDKLIECEASDHWPGAVPGQESLSLPSWVYESESDIEGLGLEGEES